ncbi:MAG: hypothetical protein GXX85_14990 [Ignavibacteria bacterium]|nr:hypothetical protein [Ignavibacteria bacterium]
MNSLFVFFISNSGYSKFRNSDIPRPDFWGGYRLIPSEFEFWQGRESRLHDRIKYSLESNEWKTSRLSP